MEAELPGVWRALFPHSDVSQEVFCDSSLRFRFQEHDSSGRREQLNRLWTLVSAFADFEDGPG